jgi:hypothetical protein
MLRSAGETYVPLREGRLRGRRCSKWTIDLRVARYVGGLRVTMRPDFIPAGLPPPVERRVHALWRRLNLRAVPRVFPALRTTGRLVAPAQKCAISIPQLPPRFRFGGYSANGNSPSRSGSIRLRIVRTACGARVGPSESHESRTKACRRLASRLATSMVMIQLPLRWVTTGRDTRSHHP